jgi:hypothetical protein
VKEPKAGHSGWIVANSDLWHLFASELDIVCNGRMFNFGTVSQTVSAPDGLANQILSMDCCRLNTGLTAEI